MKEGPAGRGGRVHGRVQRPEGNALLLEVLDQPDEIPCPTAEPIEIQHHQHVAVSQVIQAGHKAGPICMKAARPVLEYPVALGCLQSIELTIQNLALLARRNPGITNRRHAVHQPQIEAIGAAVSA